MYQIDVSNLQSALAIDDEKLRVVVERTLAAERVAAASISLAVVDNATIHDLNRRYLNHDDATDVLSFLLDSEPAGPLGAGQRIDGEIIVSAEMACQMAGEFGWRPADELVLYIVHGLLHLCGYDDHSESDRGIMRSRESAVLQTWGLAPHYSRSRAAEVD